MYNTIIFDLDGTILNTIDDLAQACNYTLRAFDLPEHNTDYYKMIVGRGIPNLINSMFPEHKRDDVTISKALEMFKKYYSSHMMDLSYPYPGIIDTLNLLKNNNIKLGVLSNKADEYVKVLLNHYFNGIFSYSLGKHPNFPTKPDPSSLNYMIRKLDTHDTCVLYCGDSDVDVLTAKNANIDSCGVLWGFRSKQELDDAGATYLIHNPNELLNILNIK